MLPIGHIIAERSAQIRDLDPGSGLPDADQPLRLVKGKRPEQDTVDDTENGRVRADSQPQRDKRGQRKSRRSRETAKRILQVTDRIHHWAIPPAHSSAGPIHAPLEDTKNPVVFKILSATKLLSIDLYAQTRADERKKSNPPCAAGRHQRRSSCPFGSRVGWPARVAFLIPLFSTPRSIFHLSASLDMLPKGV